MKAEIGTNLAKAAAILREGDLVSIPTETVYGLAGNALNQEAVLKIFKTKNRPTFDPLIVHSNSVEKIREFVTEFPEKAERLIGKFWPGPLTLLLKRTSIISDLVTSGSALVAVRVPDHPLTLDLLSSLPFPLAAPSANPFGYISPTTAAHVNDQLGDKIRYILDGGPAGIGVESTIVGFDGDSALIYRLGGISVEAIEEQIGPVKILPSSSKPSAPGMLTSHYAPSKKVIIGWNENLLDEFNVSEISFLGFHSYEEKIPKENQLLLSNIGSVDEAAANLFSFLRKLDQADSKVIIADFIPNKGLGRAVNDRLKRAAAKRLDH